MPPDLSRKVRQLRGLYANKAAHFPAVLREYDAWLRRRRHGAEGLELCRLCGRNDVVLVDPWSLRPYVHADMLAAEEVVRQVEARVRSLLDAEVGGSIRFVGHGAHFDCALVPKCSTDWYVSPRVCVEDLCWFFRYHSLPRTRHSGGHRRQVERAVSWPSLFGFWLSSRDPSAVGLLWGLLPPEVRRTWRIVDDWIGTQVRNGNMEAPLDLTAGRVEPLTTAEVRSIAAVWRKLRQQAATRCSVCRLSMFAEEVVGVQVLGTAEFEWVNHGGPTELRRRRAGTVRPAPEKGLHLCEGWDRPWRTFYGFVLWTRVWVCERRGLVVSACVFCPEHPDLWHFVTPPPPRDLFLPPRDLEYGQVDADDPWLQPANGVDLGFLGVVRLIDMTLKPSRVCYRQGDPDRPGNLVFRVLKLRGDSRGLSTSFFSMMPRAPDVSGRFTILGPSRSGWIARTVYTRPDLAPWWRELKGKGVLDEAYVVGPDVRVDHREGRRLEEAGAKRRKKEEFVSGQKAVRQAAAAALGRSGGEEPSTEDGARHVPMSAASPPPHVPHGRGTAPVGLPRDRGTSFLNSLLQVAFVVPDVVDYIMMPAPVSSDMCGDLVPLELRRALREVLLLVRDGKRPPNKEYGAMRRAFLQVAFDWKLAGVRLASGPVHASTWQVDEAKIDVPAAFNMFATECFQRAVRVVVKAEEQCRRCERVSPSVGVVDGCVWTLLHPGTKVPRVADMVRAALRTYGSSEACRTPGCAAFNVARHAYDTCPHIGQPRVEHASQLLALSVQPPEDSAGRFQPVRMSLEVDVPVVGEDRVRGYVLRGLVERVAEGEG